MIKRFVWLATAALTIVMAGCASPPPPAAAPDMREADAAAIRAVETDWRRAWESKDADMIASFWAEDASVLIPGMPMLNGRDSAKGAVMERLKDPNFFLTFDSTKVEVSKGGDIGYSQGTYTSAITDPKDPKMVATEKGKYVTVFQKGADGSWKAVADINNADGPPTMAPPNLIATPS